MSTLPQISRNVNAQEPGERFPPKTEKVERRGRPEDKRRAAEAVVYGIRLGKLLSQPCELCGTQENLRTYFAGEDSKQIRWLCEKHDREESPDQRIDLQLWLSSEDAGEYPILL